MSFEGFDLLFHGGHLGFGSNFILTTLEGLHLRTMLVKFGDNRPSGSGGEDVLKCGRTPTDAADDDGRKAVTIPHMSFAQVS